MFNKIKGLTFAVAAVGLMATAGASNATVVGVFDSGSDFTAVPANPRTLFLDFDALDTDSY